MEDRKNSSYLYRINQYITPNNETTKNSKNPIYFNGFLDDIVFKNISLIDNNHPVKSYLHHSPRCSNIFSTNDLFTYSS